MGHDPAGVEGAGVSPQPEPVTARTPAGDTEGSSPPIAVGPTAPRPRYLPLLALLACAASFAVACLFDRWVFSHVAFENIYEQDWAMLLRIAGFVPTWILGSLALLLYDRRADPRPARVYLRGLLLTAAPALAGLLCGVLKLVLRRERPRPNDGIYNFRPFDVDPFSARMLGLPSSHTMVAFALAVMASYLFPRTWPAWWLLAVGCGITRVVSRQHFLSDVVLGAFAGAFVARALWLWTERFRGPTR